LGVKEKHLKILQHRFQLWELGLFWESQIFQIQLSLTNWKKNPKELYKNAFTFSK
jgi:hypothetical protein